MHNIFVIYKYMFDKHVHTCIGIPVGVGIVLTVVDTVSAVVHMQLTSVGIVAARKEYAFKRGMSACAIHLIHSMDNIT